MAMILFGKDIKIKRLGCMRGPVSARPIPPSVNIFVKATNGCNAKCAFCSNAGYTGGSINFDHDKLWRIVDELLNKQIIVNRLNITGGEPSTVPMVVNQILERASWGSYKELHVHLNTNGLLPSSQQLMAHPRWDSISVSLHHYDRKILSNIYGVEIADEAFAFEGVDMNKVNASCNLIKGYVDSTTEVERVLQFSISLGIPRLGFVALMKVNDYCKKHYVNFDDIDFSAIPHLYFTESRNRGADCKCSNYLYNHRCKIIEVYIRNYANPNYCESSLMFDGQYLRQGFHDDNIIY